MAQKRRRRAKAQPRIRRLETDSAGPTKGDTEKAEAPAKPANPEFWHGKNTKKVASAISADVLARMATNDLFSGDLALTNEQEPSRSTATVRSLGPPPLAGRETLAEHYFEAVFQRAGAMASALLAQAAPESQSAETATKGR